ncbi:MAG: hypothetical protein KatS3mg101_0643 [Patescibacteria group bacterium]|nr:MAG: hypothetical protein KatS3mg101_0643 [Patescibacteria group bacterium]
MKKVTLALFFVVAGIVLSAVYAQDQSTELRHFEPKQSNYEGVVLDSIKIDDGNQRVIIEITNGDKKGKSVELITGLKISENLVGYQKGDKILLLSLQDPASNTETYYITDFNRTNSLFWLFILFAFVVLIVSRKYGLNSLIGMAYSFFIIFKFILPELLKGHNPLLIAILGALFIAPVTFYLSHGFNRKTSVALISTIIALFFTGIISLIFINISKLTGFGSDEAFFLQVAREGIVNIKGIFLAGIIIGTLGILDDVTVTQSSIVYQLKSSVRGIGDWELYKKAMEVGHDHIASTVNTLVLVYTGAALPLLLLFINSSKSFGEAINAEIIADEVVRTLVSSIGLVLAVPISTILAVYFITPSQKNTESKIYRNHHI